MLLWRLILGTILIAALVGLCWLDHHAARPGIYLLPLALILSLAGAGELLAMWRRRPDLPRPLTWTVYTGTLLTVLAAGAPAFLRDTALGTGPLGLLGWLALGLAVSLLLAMLGEILRYDASGQSTARLAHAVFAILYVGGLVGMLVQLRLLGLNIPDNRARLGLVALLSLILIVKLSDIGQYTAGRLYGARKLAPRISPGKTWEGVLGGMLLAVLGGFASTWLARTALGTGPGVTPRFAADDALGIWAAFLYPLALAAAGILGDLAESILKRDAGVKDSSNWLPGFGGVLDILDSLLAAAPLAYLYWALAYTG